MYINKGIFHQYLAATTGAMCAMIVSTSVAWPSPILVKMNSNETPFHLSIDEKSWMVSLLFLGYMVSPLPSGCFMEKIGRKNSLLYLSCLPALSWALIYFATAPFYLYVARFLAGLWAGITATISPIYVGEIAEPGIRGSLSTINSLCSNSGVLLVYIVGPFVSYYTLAVICGSITILYIATYVRMPESPYFYLMKNREEEAFASLKWLRGDKSDDTIRVELDEIRKAIAKQLQNEGHIKDIFLNAGTRKAFIIAEVYALLKRMSGSRVIQAYASTTLPDKVFGILNPNECVMILGIVGLLTSFLSTYLAVHFERRVLLTVSSLGSGITMLTAGVWFALDNSDFPVQDINYIPFLSFALFNIAFGIGLGPNGAVIKGEMFPANVKAMSSALTTVSIAIISFFLNKFYLIFAELFGMYINYFIYAISCFSGVIFTLTYVPETKGKTLQEIQDILNGVKPKSISRK